MKDQSAFLGLITLEDLSEVFQVMGAKMSRSGPPALSNGGTPAGDTQGPSEHSAADA